MGHFCNTTRESLCSYFVLWTCFNRDLKYLDLSGMHYTQSLFSTASKCKPSFKYHFKMLFNWFAEMRLWCPPAEVIQMMQWACTLEVVLLTTQPAAWVCLTDSVFNRMHCRMRSPSSWELWWSHWANAKKTSGRHQCLWSYIWLAILKLFAEGGEMTVWFPSILSSRSKTAQSISTLVKYGEICMPWDLMHNFWRTILGDWICK